MRRKPRFLLGLLAGLGVLFMMNGNRQLPSSFVGPAPEQEPVSGRDRIVQIAEAEEGKSDADKYWSAVLELGQQKPATSWCGAFALWVLRQAGLTSWGYDDDGAWFYQLPWTNDPQPGDLAFIESKRHLGIVKSVNSDGTITLINGAGSANQVSIAPTARSNITEFRSVAPLLEAA